MTHKLSTAEMHRLSVEEYRRSNKLPLTVVLDNIRSQNNIGSVFRTADAFRVGHIALCGICSTPPHREIHKTALGAEDSVEWSHHGSTAQCLLGLKERGVLVYAVEQVSDSIKPGGSLWQAERARWARAAWAEPCPAPSVAAGRPVAIVLGNEIEGVSDEALALCDGSIEIPQSGTKHSLNVSCAAAIVMWEMYKAMTMPCND
ncbi:MAG: RNA methyltransferase [Bacteroidales bacterium]|nr:RNA methyltransferase [Bacteroidales bacterium]